MSYTKHQLTQEQIEAHNRENQETILRMANAKSHMVEGLERPRLRTIQDEFGELYTLLSDEQRAAAQKALDFIENAQTLDEFEILAQQAGVSAAQMVLDSIRETAEQKRADIQAAAAARSATRSKSLEAVRKRYTSEIKPELLSALEKLAEFNNVAGFDHGELIAHGAKEVLERLRNAILFNELLAHGEHAR
ncbi:MAG: hypothetical protein JXK05_13345 [Campylobacterales bacterium]|nr:hypothetical protein [Campylobacterales bacterium]